MPLPLLPPPPPPPPPLPPPLLRPPPSLRRLKLRPVLLSRRSNCPPRSRLPRPKSFQSKTNNQWVISKMRFNWHVIVIIVIDITTIASKATVFVGQIVIVVDGIVVLYWTFDGHLFDQYQNVTDCIHAFIWFANALYNAIGALWANVREYLENATSHFL